MSHDPGEISVQEEKCAMGSKLVITRTLEYIYISGESQGLT
jgi:hypothetical protein